jgi:hypothetical protein
MTCCLETMQVHTHSMSSSLLCRYSLHLLEGHCGVEGDFARTDVENSIFGTTHRISRKTHTNEVGLQSFAEQL